MSATETAKPVHPSPNCFWSRPLQQPIFDRRNRVLVCISKDSLPLPQRCCRCGSKTEGTFSAKVEKTRNETSMSAALLVATHGHIVSAICELTRKKVQIPCCPSCRLLHRFGFAAGLVVAMFSVVPFIFIMTRDHDAALRAPVWQVAASFGLSLIFIFAGVGISLWGTRRAVPVVVYQLDSRTFYFELWSSHYQKLVPHSVIQASAERKQN